MSSTPAVGCVCVGISLRHQTFVNSSALLIPLMALRSCYGTETPFGLVVETSFSKLQAQFSMSSVPWSHFHAISSSF